MCFDSCCFWTELLPVGFHLNISHDYISHCSYCSMNGTYRINAIHILLHFKIIRWNVFHMNTPVNMAVNSEVQF